MLVAVRWPAMKEATETRLVETVLVNSMEVRRMRMPSVERNVTRALVTDNDQRRLTIQLPIDRIAGCLVMCVAPCLTSDDSFIEVRTYTMTR